MLKRVADLLCSIVKADPKAIKETDKLVDDLGLNSLDVVNVAVLFEDEFLIEIPDRQISRFVTVGDICDYLKERNISA